MMADEVEPWVLDISQRKLQKYHDRLLTYKAWLSIEERAKNIPFCLSLLLGTTSETEKFFDIPMISAVGNAAH